MARRDYLTPDERGKYDVGTQLQFKKIPYGRPLNYKTPWYKYIPGYLAMALGALVATVIVSWLKLAPIVQMFVVVGGGLFSKFYVDWKLRV